MPLLQGNFFTEGIKGVQILAIDKNRGGGRLGRGPGACSPEKMLTSGPLLKQELEYKQTSLNYFSSFSKREYKNNLFVLISS